MEIMRDVCGDFETGLAEFNGEANHVHLLLTFLPKTALSRLVNSLKGVSSGGCDRRLAVRPSASWATTSSSKTARSDQHMSSAFTTGLKAGTLADL
jgi:REP element-mobilizing transposase RayT